MRFWRRKQPQQEVFPSQRLVGTYPTVLIVRVPNPYGFKMEDVAETHLRAKIAAAKIVIALGPLPSQQPRVIKDALGLMVDDRGRVRKNGIGYEWLVTVETGEAA
jgi:hypothetical protein